MGAPIMPVPPQPEWPRPPVGGYTADDLDRLPNLPPHTELIDGSLVFVSPQTAFHTLTVRLLENRLTRAAPPDLMTFREMTIAIDARNRPEPDVMVVRSDAFTGLAQTAFQPADVVLAIEVVSADSEARDRESKPLKYAAAGIPHFWRVEEARGLPVVYVFELEPARRTYAVTGIYHERLKVAVPFPVEIDLTAVDPRQRGGTEAAPDAE
ncbi:Uma2 family endonuclease [Streptomyces buecherae]|uniref:Uma2 family endonuclease n=1 Tax=Streptomyces buecherae TaxID=2763006 RepID=UPI0036A49CCF